MLSFGVLSDPGSRLAGRIGIDFQQADEVLAAQRQLGLDLDQVNAEGATRLPRPTVLAVERDRVVRFVNVQPDCAARTEVTGESSGMGLATAGLLVQEGALACITGHRQGAARCRHRTSPPPTAGCGGRLP